MRKLNAPTRQYTIKILRPVVDLDGLWRAHDENLEYDELIEPSQYIIDCIGGRPFAYFRAVRSAEGWQVRQVLRQQFYW